MKLKEVLKEKYYQNNESIKTHIRINGVNNGITGFYNDKELLEKYGECEAETVYYEKDYGDGAIAIRRFLAIDVYEERSN